jgi:hypothetical protein
MCCSLVIVRSFGTSGMRSSQRLQAGSCILHKLGEAVKRVRKAALVPLRARSPSSVPPSPPNVRRHRRAAWAFFACLARL